ncbi:MAG: helix-turn-helix transcriptional regulator [Clostridiales bacterium]|nr:helix-turn-helix transcriptional regulator [Clostridiales bacterium]
MKITEYKEKLSFLNLGTNSDFLDIRAAGYVEPDVNYQMGDIPTGYSLIEFIIDGHAYIEAIERSPYELNSGDLLICCNTEQIKYLCDQKNPQHKLWLTLRGRYLDSLLELYSIDRSTNIVNSPECGAIVAHIIKFVSTYGIRELELCHMLLDLFDKAFTPKRSRHELPLSEQIKNTLDRHLEKPVTVSDIAAYFCKSARHIERVFENEYGTTIYKYLRERRFAAACRELRQTDDLVYMIAERYHLGSPSFFAREFKKRFGITPNDYRERFKNGALINSVGASLESMSFETIYDYVPYTNTAIK